MFLRWNPAIPELDSAFEDDLMNDSFEVTLQTLLIIYSPQLGDILFHTKIIFKDTVDGKDSKHGGISSSKKNDAYVANPTR